MESELSRTMRAYAAFSARKYGMKIFFTPSMWSPSLAPFDGWELVALPDGRVMDAIPLDSVPVHMTSRNFMEAFA